MPLEIGASAGSFLRDINGIDTAAVKQVKFSFGIAAVAAVTEAESGSRLRLRGMPFRGPVHGVMTGSRSDLQLAMAR